MMRKTTRYVKGLLLAALLTAPAYLPPAQSATLLPNGMQTFLDGNGAPVAGGCVYFYVPGTTTPKDTYSDPTAATANTNPVQLDAAGRAIIYGVGTYRQIVTQPGTNPGFPCAPGGTQEWDQLTADTASAVVIYAGASAGTPNSITVTAPSFTGQDGQVINYISTNTNTAAATLNPSGFGAIQIVRDSATGPGALTGGELVATNAVSVIYDANAGVFHILSPVNWPNTAGVPIGTVIPVAGFTAPTNYAFAYGQAVSRTTYASLLTALTLGQTGSISSVSPTITGLADTTQLGFGMPVESTGIPAGATILSCTSTTCTLSANATLTRSGTMTFFAYGNGDGSTTFNLPDYRGLSMVGRDNMGGTAANSSQLATTVTTTSGSNSVTVASATGIAIGMYVQSANIPGGTTVTAIAGTTLTMSQNASASAGGTAARFSPLAEAQALGVRAGATAHAQAASEVVQHNHPVFLNDPGHTHTISPATGGMNVIRGDGGGGSFSFAGGGFGATIVTATASATTGITVRDASGGGGTANQTATSGSSNPMLIYNPQRTINYAVRLVP
jgi:microcystin-dependent protein